MKKIIYLFFVSLVFIACSSEKAVNISVKNNADFDRSAEMVQIPLSALNAKLPLSGGLTYVVKNAKGDTVASQITYDSLLIFQYGSTDAQADFTITAGASVTFAPKVFGRLYPERRDDFSWENDRVGYRLYGRPLMELDGPSNALDLWFKRTDSLILDKWYHNDIVDKISFHIDHGEGCDPYAVGHSLGAGAMAPYVNGELILNDNAVSSKILDKGPLRFTVELSYPDIVVDSVGYSETRTVSLDAGSQLNKIVQAYGVKAPMKVAAGIVKRAAHDSVLWANGNNFFVYEEPVSEENGQIYIGIIIPNGIDTVAVAEYDYFHPLKKEAQHYAHTLAVADYTSGTPMVYYAGYGWNKFGFADAAAFNAYVKQFSEAIKLPFTIIYK